MRADTDINTYRNISKMKKCETRIRRSLLWAVAAFFFLTLTGCKGNIALQNDMRNVEQRDYATILVVADGKDGKNYEFSLGIAQEKKTGEKSQTEEVSTFYANTFEELAQEYQLVKGKELSLSHLKVILLARESNLIMESQWDILNAMDEDREIAKTCPVLQLSDKDAFLQYLKDAKEPVGTYINDLVESTEGLGRDIPWLKDYLKVLREGTTLQVYFLETVPEGWQLKCRAEVTVS